jgi:predicted transcriptional regulator
MLTAYEQEIENQMITFFDTLSEKDKCRYAAIETLKLPYGGRSYISKLLNCSFSTIDKALEELKDNNLSDSERIRKSGGGRKSFIESILGIDDFFLKVLKDFTAGDPMDEEVKWTHLTYTEIAEAMSAEGVDISKPTVKKLLKHHGYVKRKAFKNVKRGTAENRDEQFENIASKKQAYERQGNPVISVDTKKRVVRQFIS